MRHARNRIAFSLTLGAVLCIHEAHARDAWSYDLIPFVWTSSLDGQQQISQVGVDMDAFGSLWDFNNIGGALRFSAHGESLSLFGEVDFLDLDQDGLGPLGNTRLAIKQIIAEAGVSYSFNDLFAVYGGARYQDLDNQLTLAGVESQVAQSWVDGMVGVQWTPVATNSWLVWLRSDIGGGGSDLMWMVETGTAYAWSDRNAVYLAWRLLDTEYQKDDFLYDVQQDGLMLGFGFRF